MARVDLLGMESAAVETLDHNCKPPFSPKPRREIEIAMQDDLITAKSAIAKLHKEMEAINRFANPSYLSVFEQLERTMEPIRRQQLGISRALEISGAAARIKEIASANQHWQELIKEATASSRIAESLHAAHRS